MSFTKAQERYDAQLPPEDPEEHEYSGDVVVGDTLFTFCINEAGVAGEGETATGVLYGFLTTAIGELISLREALP